VPSPPRDRPPRILYDPLLRRLWVCDRRVHHGLVGLALAGLGAALMIHDRSDWRVWLQ
jgi:hypothetical protein